MFHLEIACHTLAITRQRFIPSGNPHNPVQEGLLHMLRTEMIGEAPVSLLQHSTKDPIIPVMIITDSCSASHDCTALNWLRCYTPDPTKSFNGASASTGSRSAVRLSISLLIAFPEAEASRSKLAHVSSDHIVLRTVPSPPMASYLPWKHECFYLKVTVVSFLASQVDRQQAATIDIRKRILIFVAVMLSRIC